MMKHKIQLTVAALVLSCVVGAQSLVLSYQGETLAPNAGITIEGLATDFEIVAYLDVTNTSSGDISVRVQRYENNMIPGAQSSICWGLWYPPHIGLSPYTILIPAGATNSTDFAAHYYPNGNAGISEIDFVFFDDNNPTDEVLVTTFFNALITGVDNIRHEALSRVYPNPANTFVNIDIYHDLTNDIRIELMSVTGAVVAESTVHQKITTINTSDLPGGLYFYRLHLNGEVVESGRIVIRH
jgi:hypothetical protein